LVETNNNNNEGETMTLYNYPTIQAWHILTGSLAYYVDNMVRKAQAENAPLDATYKNNDGKWVRLRDVENQEFANQCWVKVLQLTKEL
tara:strand:+ start:447 stop:710 length:264 start_codon:yes stop_codon:yes gene_type:complete